MEDKIVAHIWQMVLISIGTLIGIAFTEIAVLIQQQKSGFQWGHFK